ncbi:BRO-N domain-containing protein [Clostridium butyricum]|uniref:BRO-N domain-containing protein n=1 Tax=Clostridium butyricum TaxID=1492 RepID=UPI002ABE5BEF|nr:BRO family protein [Clostridium butyricum]
MNNLMIFENKQVEVFEWKGQVLFNPKHVADCLDISDVNSSIRNFNDNQVVKLTNSKMHNMQFRKLHNTGENFLTESGVYKLIFKSKKAEAERFQDWVTDEVLPQIRKTGSYANNQNSINEFKGQLTTMVNNLFEDKLKEVKEYYKINSKSKFDLSSYIKKRLGILRADDEYEQVKARVFLLLNINKWEDLNVENYKDVLPVIDESIRIIKLDRLQQIGMWD